MPRATMVDMARSNRLDALSAHFAANGPIAHVAELAAVASRAAVRTASEQGLITPMGSGVYVLSEFAAPTLGARCASPSWVPSGAARARDVTDAPGACLTGCEEARLVTGLMAVARGMNACLSHRCAAIAHGWPVLLNPETVEVAVPAGRRPPKRVAAPVTRRVRDLTRDEVLEGRTSPLATVVDCSRDLPIREGLAIADSALRSGSVGASELREAGERAAGPGAPRVRRVARLADGRRANPFESVVAAELDAVEGLNLVPQFVIEDCSEGFFARVDAADPWLRLVVEADSYEFHGGREAFRADRRRYIELTARGWLVVPVTMPMAMDTPAWLRRQVRRLVDLREFQFRMELARRDTTSTRQLRR